MKGFSSPALETDSKRDNLNLQKKKKKEFWNDERLCLSGQMNTIDNLTTEHTVPSPKMYPSRIVSSSSQGY